MDEIETLIKYLNEREPTVEDLKQLSKLQLLVKEVLNGSRSRRSDPDGLFERILKQRAPIPKETFTYHNLAQLSTSLRKGRQELDLLVAQGKLILDSGKLRVDSEYLPRRKLSKH